MKRNTKQTFPRYESLWKWVKGDVDTLRTITSASSGDAGLLWIILPELFELNTLYVLERKSKNKFKVRTRSKRTNLFKTTLDLKKCSSLFEHSYLKKCRMADQVEIQKSSDEYFVEAMASIPLIIQNQIRIIAIHKQLILPKKQVEERYILDSYLVEFIELVIRAFLTVGEKERELIQAEKMAALGTMASALVHEINQPLTVIRGIAQNRLINIDGSKKLSIEEIFQAFKDIENQTTRMNELTDNLLRFARKSKVEFEDVSLNDVVRATLGFLKMQLKHRNIETLIVLDRTLPAIWGNSIQLQQVLLNLMLNTRDAMTNSPKKELAITTLKSRKNVIVSIKDTGCGIPEENKHRIFEPFFSTKPIGEGIGLGLSVSYGIIKHHGGEIKFESEVGFGTTFNVVLPRRKG